MCQVSHGKIIEGGKVKVVCPTHSAGQGVYLSCEGACGRRGRTWGLKGWILATPRFWTWRINMQKMVIWWFLTLEWLSMETPFFPWHSLWEAEIRLLLDFFLDTGGFINVTESTCKRSSFCEAGFITSGGANVYHDKLDDDEQIVPESESHKFFYELLFLLRQQLATLFFLKRGFSVQPRGVRLGVALFPSQWSPLWAFVFFCLHSFVW